jgi:hypothetical protein
MAEGSIRTAFMFLLVAFLTLFVTASVIAGFHERGANLVSGDVVNVKSERIIRVPNSTQPLPNTEEGSIVLWTKPPIKIFDQFVSDRDYIIFFSSTNVPGVRIVYNLKTHRFEAGTPLMSSPVIDIFDETPHQLVYVFKKGENQALMLDGAQVNESKFKPLEIMKATGFAIADVSATETEIEGAEVVVYDRYMTEDMMGKI